MKINVKTMHQRMFKLWHIADSGRQLIHPLRGYHFRIDESSFYADEMGRHDNTIQIKRLFNVT